MCLNTASVSHYCILVLSNPLFALFRDKKPRRYHVNKLHHSQISFQISRTLCRLSCQVNTNLFTWVKNASTITGIKFWM